MANITDDAIYILRVMQEHRFTSRNETKVPILRSLVNLGEDSFMDAYLYLLRSGFIKGAGNDITGSRHLSVEGINYLDIAMQSHENISLQSEKILRYIVKNEPEPDRFGTDFGIPLKQAEEVFQISPKEVKSSFQELDDLGFIEAVAGDRSFGFGVMSTAEGRKAVNRGFRKVGLSISSLSEFGEKSVTEISKDTKKVFVVHGRNELARKAVFSFLRSINLKPLEWSTLVSLTKQGAPYVGKILDTAFSEAQAVVVLLTPDDEVKLREEFQTETDSVHETEFTYQARPNVLFEAGMAMGRHPDRTIIVELGKLRPFSDITGRHTIRLNNSSEKRQELAQRLETAGCAVDLSGRDWHSEGDFESCFPSS